jgi:hypothetical protein
MGESRRWGRTIAGGLLIGAACAALFLVPSAWLVHLGQSRWLALAAGLVVFPLLPVGWHLVAERRRKRDAAKSSLTPSDRFLLRLVAVAVVVIVPLLVFARGRTWTAVKQNWTWYLDWVGGDGETAGGWETATGEPITGDARLITYLPDDAEVVIWMRTTRQFLDSMARQFGGEVEKPDPDAPQEVLMALRKDGFLALVRARKGLDEIEAKDREKLERELAENFFGGRRIKVLIYSAQPDLHVVVSENWDAAVRARAAGTRPAPAELLALLESTPDDAPLIAAARNAAIGGVIVERGTGHLRIADKGLRIETDMQLASETAAGLLRRAIASYVDQLRREAPDTCKAPVGKLVSGVDVAGSGTAVTMRAKLGFEDLVAAMFCQLGEADSGDDDD